MNTENHHWLDNLDLNNLVPYTRAPASWSDRQSNLSLFWMDESLSGLPRLHIQVGWGSTPIIDNLLRWSINDGHEVHTPVLKHRCFRPDYVIEESICGPFKVRTRVAWPHRNALAMEFEVTNSDTHTRKTRFVFDYPGKNTSPDWTGPFPVDHLLGHPLGHFVRLPDEPEGSWSTLFRHNAHGHGIVWVEAFVTGLTQGTPLELVCLSDVAVEEITLAPGASHRFIVPLAFGCTRGSARRVFERCQKSLAEGWAIEDERNRWQDILRAASAPAEKYIHSQAHCRHYAHAIAGLHSLFIQGEGGYTGDKCIPYTTRCWIAIAFFWDTAFSCLAARHFSPRFCEEAIECFVDNPSPRGAMPGVLCDSHRAGEGQLPLMSWVAWKVYEKGGNVDWLKRVYPGLCQNINFWFRHHSSERGLCKFFNAGQIGDDDARFDAVYGRSQANEPLYGLESPDLNSFIFLEMKSLSKISAELGIMEESRGWLQRAEVLGRKIVEVFYFPEESMFYDVREGAHEKFTGTKSPNMFMPLWAGVPLPEVEVKKIIERHMLNSNEFFRELPYPSLSYDDPRYDANGYWRGKIWPHIVNIMIHTLWKHGYRQQAELTADRLLTLLTSTPWYQENYCSDPAFQGTDEKHGLAEYNWSQATAIELILETYKLPLLD